MTLPTSVKSWTAVCNFSGRRITDRDESYYLDDNSMMTASATFNFLRCWLYNARTDMKPFWNNLVVIGMEDHKPYVVGGCVGCLMDVHSNAHFLQQELLIPVEFEEAASSVSVNIH